MVEPQIIIVIGLPGSGKTFFCKNFNHENLYAVFDDFISDFYNGKLLDYITSGQKVIINDPRLCIKSIFIKYISIFESYVNSDQINLILFENNPKQCITNVKIRNDRRNNIIESITEYSKKYLLENYTRLDYKIIKIYPGSKYFPEVQ